LTPTTMMRSELVDFSSFLLFLVLDAKGGENYMGQLLLRRQVSAKAMVHVYSMRVSLLGCESWEPLKLYICNNGTFITLCVSDMDMYRLCGLACHIFVLVVYLFIYNLLCGAMLNLCCCSRCDSATPQARQCRSVAVPRLRCSSAAPSCCSKTLMCMSCHLHHVYICDTVCSTP
jgi:hypothetical protein